MPNLFANLPHSLPEELTTVLAESKHVRIERIVSTGQASPQGFWYDQADEEWVVVLQGTATLHFDDGAVLPMSPGDHVLIPAHRRHRVEHTSTLEPTVWLAVFYAA
jgi:cupin 2 domain-containing protein